ncbi:hypothetical protein [Haloglomus halophilum]|jgi:hypothetical protein|uniref:hypothetical protein n=1 Tax=Haloglomus halophilum TaxID=2962672 RepID=UPI0020C95979|nr:hypothetical protein [Haloglomus halophilum]
MDVARTRRLLSGRSELSGTQLAVAASLLFLTGLAVHRLWAVSTLYLSIAIVPIIGAGIAASFGYRSRSPLRATLLGLAPFLGFVSLETYYALFGTPFVTVYGGPAPARPGAGDLQPMMTSFGYPGHLTLGVGLVVVLLGYLLGRVRRASGTSTGDA